MMRTLTHGTRTLARARFSFVAALLALCLGRGASVGLAAEGQASLDINYLYNAGLYEQAIKVLDASLKSNPNDASMEEMMGRCFYQLGDYNRAIDALERAVMLDPSRSESHDWLGKAYGRKAEGTSNPISALSLAGKVRKEFAEAVRLNPSNLAAQRDLIRYLLNSPGLVGGGQDRADEQIKALSAVDPVEGQLARAEADVARKKFDAADQEYGNLLDSHPHRIGVVLEIAEYYRDRNDANMMEKAVEEAAALDPSDIRLNYYRGVVLVVAQRDQTNAERYLRAYLDSAPENSELPSRASAREFLGRLYEQQHKLDSAAEQYRDGLALDPHDKSLHDDLKRVQKR
jgi:tetratricopeptide (TPR) repeat protein